MFDGSVCLWISSSTSHTHERETVLPGGSRPLGLKEIDGSQPARVSRAAGNTQRTQNLFPPHQFPPLLPSRGLQKEMKHPGLKLQPVKDPPSPTRGVWCGAASQSLSQKEVRKSCCALLPGSLSLLLVTAKITGSCYI